MLTSEKMRGRNEAEGDSRWGQIEGRDLMHYVDMDLGNGNTTVAYWDAHVGTSAAEDLMGNQEGGIKIHFQKASHWYFLFASFSLGLCLYNVLCRIWGHKETG